MKKSLLGMVGTAALLTACGDDASNNPTENNLETTNPAISSSSDGLSSSSGETEYVNHDSVAVSYGNLVDSRDGKSYRVMTLKDTSDSYALDTLGQRHFDSWMIDDLAYDKEYMDQIRVENGIHYYPVAAAMDSLKTWCGHHEDIPDIWYCELSEPEQGICPEGWHVPSPEDMKWWRVFLDRSSEAQKAFYRSSESRECEETDYFWSTTESGYALFYGFESRKECAGQNVLIEQAAPIRCVKDEEHHIKPSIPSEYDGDFVYYQDARDGKNFKSVVIGNQTWMAENLDCSHGSLPPGLAFA